MRGMIIDIFSYFHENKDIENCHNDAVICASGFDATGNFCISKDSR
jgi:hypothetical protein